MSRQSPRLAARPAATVTALAVAVAALGLAAAPAATAAYPPAAPQCSLATSSNTPGAPVTVSGVGFPAGSVVTVTGSGAAVLPVPSVRARADGSVSVVEKLGQRGSAVFTLGTTAVNTRCGAVAVAAQVLPSVAATTPAPVVEGQPLAPTTVSGLAFTGASHIVTVSLVGLALLGGGSGLVLLGRRRARA